MGKHTTRATDPESDDEGESVQQENLSAPTRTSFANTPVAPTTPKPPTPAPVTQPATTQPKERVMSEAELQKAKEGVLNAQQKMIEDEQLKHAVRAYPVVQKLIDELAKLKAGAPKH